MAQISIPFTFSAGATIIASQQNSNFSTIYNDYNSNIDNSNIVAGAGILYSKLTLTNGILNADINSSAAIVDSKLAQITTASKVSGTAITGLASLPSGAGVIPVANLGSGSSSTKFLRGDSTFANTGLSLISTTTLATVATSGNIAVTSGNTYFIQFDLNNLSAAEIIILQMNADGGGNYKFIVNGFNTSGTGISNNGTAQTSINLSKAVVNNPGAGITGSIHLQQVGSASQVYQVWGQATFLDNASSLLAAVNIGGWWSNSANITSFVISTSGGATMTGKVYLYQVATS